MLKIVTIAALAFGSCLMAQDATPLQHRAPDMAESQPQALLPARTGLHIAINEELSSETAKINDGFSGKLVDPVVVNGTTLLPAGTVIHGRIKDVSNPSHRFQGKTTLTLRPDTIIFADGRQADISALMIDSFDRKAYRVDAEGSISNSARHYATMSGIGAGVGTVAGAVVGGPVGAVAGATLGAGLPAGRWATKNDVIVLPAGSDYWFELSKPARLNVSERSQAAPATSADSRTASALPR